MATPKKQKPSGPVPRLALDYSHEDEAATRARVDVQLRQGGWEVNSKELTFASGARPQRGLNRAIAEWPTSSGPADYVLFVGLTPLGIAEAKRHIKDVTGRLPQARRYSRGFAAQGNESFLGGPWDKHKIPFVFATNGRPFLRQLQEKSGIWFQDLRLSTNHPRPLNGWHSPDGLMNLFKAYHVAAAAALLDNPVNLAALHDYQVAAVEKVEEAIAAGNRTALVAMATGTGKTRVAIALLFRLIKHGRFRRALFLVVRLLKEALERRYGPIHDDTVMKITGNLNLLPALVVVAQRPRELTRTQLKEIKLALDEAGYSEINLHTAWREWKNQDIAATIIGFIRHRALGSALLPYAERVEHALHGILASHAWTAPQRQWLQRIANQIKAETVVDRDAFDHGVFAANGGFARLNKTFDGQLETVVIDLHDRIWQDVA